MKPILVHGGGKAISQAMNEAGIEARFVHGRRYTDEQTLDIASRVLAEEICASLVQEIQTQGGQSVGLSYATDNVLIAEPLELTDDSGSPLDLGFVGHVVDIDRDVLEKVVNSETIPVLPSVAMTRDGQRLNVNADTAAAAVARLLKAEKLVFLSDVPGIFRDKKRSGDADFPPRTGRLPGHDRRRDNRRRYDSQSRRRPGGSSSRRGEGAYRRWADAAFRVARDLLGQGSWDGNCGRRWVMGDG